MNAPVRLDDVLLAEMLWAAFKALFTITAILGVMTLLGICQTWKLLLAWPILLGAGITFSRMALIFNALAKGYQLTHSLIALGRGEIFGVGLGGSVEKLHWLPEAHTDFLLAVIGEEFGLVGVLVLIVLFLWMTRRIIHIGRQAVALDRVFAGLVAQGVGIWMGFQAFINMGVNLGALPTKGLTLPLMSYGGSAILINLVALAVVLRIDYENRVMGQGVPS
jgi:cell division protein FtsW (lipid II flippase)